MNATNPATEQLVSTYPDHTTDQVKAALSRAADTARNWRSKPIPQRAELLHRAAQFLREDLGQVARIITCEMGKPIAQAEPEVEKCATGCDHYAQFADTYLADEPVKTDAD